MNKKLVSILSLSIIGIIVISGCVGQTPNLKDKYNSCLDACNEYSGYLEDMCKLECRYEYDYRMCDNPCAKVIDDNETAIEEQWECYGDCIGYSPDWKSEDSFWYYG